MKAMREALEYASRVLAKWRQDAPFRAWNEYGEAIDKCRAALAKPPRQCDVGTAEEQVERFENFCLKHIGCAEETGGRHCVGCPLEKASKHITQKCELYWAQMPYNERRC